MGNRYSDIRRGGELKQALDDYVQYLSNMQTRATKRQTGGTYAARPGEIVPVFLRPFGVPVANTDVVQNRANDTAFAGPADLDGIPNFGTGADARFEHTTTTKTVVSAPKGFSPARCTAFVRNGTPAYVRSKVTKLYYIKYPGKSYAVPFGRQMNAAGDTEGAQEQEIYQNVKRDVLAAITPTNAGSRVSIKDERLRAIK